MEELILHLYSQKNFKKIKIFCEQNNFPFPTFMVIRNGNHVMERQNIGKFEQIFTKNQLVKQSKILDCISLCTKFNTMSKIHNTDIFNRQFNKIT